MARKRKIPVRKHHGVRDPLKQLEEREKKLKNVVNNPPALTNDQKVSYKFAQFKKLADSAKSGKKFKRIHSGQEDKPAAAAAGKHNASTTGSKKLRQIKQMYDESDEDYLRRVNRVTSESLREAQYEAKYGVNVVRDAKTGAITIKKRPKNEIDELLKQKQLEKRKMHSKNSKQTKGAKPMDPKLAKELIKRAIKEEEEEKMKESLEPEEYKRDVFKFGEVVHAPPTLSTLPRKAVKSETVPRPGKKSNLLLKSLLNGEGNTAVASTTSAKSTTKKQSKSSVVTKAQLKGKRKDLPAATRHMLESEQSKIIELYRNLKKSKVKASE